MPHPFRFGVQISRAGSRDELASLARKIEDLGYTSLGIPDHFDDQLAPFPALLAAADATERLRVLPLVIDNDFQHPAVLAREAATVDLLTDGRLELGLGAGWMRTDYERSGIAFDPAGTRVDKLAESVTVLKGLFGDGPFTFDGEHYTVTEMEGHPTPRQRPHPPILIGGGGQRVLSLAGRQADVVGLNANLRAGEVTPDIGPDVVAEQTDQKLAWIRQAAGDRFDELEINILIYAVAVTDDRQAAAQTFADGFGLTAEQVLGIPHFLIGTVDQIAEDLQARRERWGINYPIVQGGMSDLAPVVERLTGT